MTTDRAFGESLEEAHELLSYLLLILVGMHAAAAVCHQAVLKDGALARMLPFGRTSSRSRKEDSA
jgi:cytochrome b561